ncbi:MAG: sugar isomerase [Phycisphaeraceae bacterium]|nr:sugar isomerase [Phycisphaeraceae bacterium]
MVVVDRMAGSTAESAREYLEHAARIAKAIDTDAIDRYARTLYEAWRDDRAVFVFGNGGSASTASHHVCDYVKTASVEGRRRLRAFSLVDNVGLLTAIGNDLSFDDTFVLPLETMAKPGDVAIAISCSGNSPNVVRACRWAKDHGLTIVALSGFEGGAMAALADLHINVPNDNYGIIEDMHLSIGHMVTQRLQALVRDEATCS